MSPEDRNNPYGDFAFDFFDEGSHRLFSWCGEHWKATVAVVAGTPVLVGVMIGFIAGRCF